MSILTLITFCVILNLNKISSQLIVDEESCNNGQFSWIQDSISKISLKLQQLNEETETTDCPPDFEYVLEFHKCYRIIYDRFEWEVSRDLCNSLHPKSHLIVIQNSFDQLAMESFLKSKKYDIELKCRENIYSRYLIWTSGQRVINLTNSSFFWKPYNNKWIPLIYTNWDDSQPDFLNRDSCMHIHTEKMKWNDVPCAIDPTNLLGMQCSLCEIDMY